MYVFNIISKTHTYIPQVGYSQHSTEDFLILLKCPYDIPVLTRVFSRMFLAEDFVTFNSQGLFPHEFFLVAVLNVNKKMYTKDHKLTEIRYHLQFYRYQLFMSSI